MIRDASRFGAWGVRARIDGYASDMGERDHRLRTELGQTLALFGTVVGLVLAVLMAGLGL